MILELNGLESYPSLHQFLTLLLKWNRKINLTSLNDPKRILEELFIDSLTLLDHVKGEDRLLDVGSGAGLPGLVLKIALPEMDLVSVESIKKKCDFQKEVVRRLGLKGVDVVNLRLSNRMNIGLFDKIVSRGTMKIAALLSLVRCYLKEGGSIITAKGEDPSKEVSEARTRYPDAGIEVRRYELPISKKRRALVVIRFARTGRAGSSL